MTEREHELLNRFIDGELRGDETAEFERSLQGNPELAVMRDDFLSIGTMLREHIGEEVEAADFSGFMSGLDVRLDAEEAAPTAAYEPQAPTATETTRKDSIFDRFQGWWRQNWGPMMLGAAAAAAIMVYALRTEPPTQSPKSVQVAAGQSDGDVIVDSISNEGSKTILVSMPAENGESTVIWLLDGEDEDEGPIDGEDPI
jgi:negative regulator of sigma E activity